MRGSHIVWAIVGGFLIGVFARSVLPIGIAYAYFALMLALAALVCGFFHIWIERINEKRKVPALIVIAVALSSCSIGIMRMNAATITGDPHLSAMLGKHVTLLGTVTAEPDVRDSGVRVSLAANELQVGSTTIPVSAGVLVQVPPHAAVRYGDAVRASGTLDLPQAFDTGDGRSFDYPDYLGASGIAYELSFAQVKTLGNNDRNPIVTAVIDLKETYLDGIDAVLPEPEAGLAGGITVGDKRSIGPQLSADFQKVGLIQMVVLSGYNITVVANFASVLLTRASRYLQFGAGIFVVIFFILISGGASSAVRAGLMAALAMYARHTGRTYDSLRALALVALIMVAWNPFTLVFDPGFQLSALAMLGLALFTPTFESYLQWVTTRFALREIISTTLATQLAVSPLLLYQDGTLSLLVLPANVACMLPVPLAMLTSFIAAIFGAVFGTIAVPIAYPAYLLLSYIITLAHLLASLPLASIHIGSFGVIALFGTYAILFGGFWIWQKSAKRKSPPEKALS